ncbi:MAG: RHS repeat-associated core domain-containing protein, partial [Myxococcales bacterium]|nr:RHS repeat-associated core domain-containing protein [Myxococcales bacterium]
GRVIRTAIVGKGGEGDSVQSDDAATSTVAYELERWRDEQRPCHVITRVRETHQSALGVGETTRWLTRLTYLGGGGRAVLVKATAAPGPAVALQPDGTPALVDDGTGTLGVQVVHSDPRWIASGRTVVDNKGNPIKQYEPYFSQTDEYEDDPTLVQWGVTPVMHHDPLGRLIRVDMPDGTHTRTSLGPWSQIVWDASDTAQAGQLWYDARYAEDPGVAAQMAPFVDTPTVTRFDPLGRPVCSAEHERVGTSDHLRETTVTLDLGGSTLAVTDAAGRDCMTYAHDMLGQPLWQRSIDAGERWMLATPSGDPVKTWGERLGTALTPITHRAEYDALRRLTHTWLDEGDGGAERLVERLVYGEAHPSVPGAPAEDPLHPDHPNARNLRGRLVAHYDQAGATFVEAFDFEGHPTGSTRRLASSHDTVVDWSALQLADDFDGSSAAAAALLEQEAFSHRLEHDALGRATSITTPDGTVTQPQYDQGGRLVRVEALVQGATPVVVVPHIDYDAHGRRTQVTRSDTGSGATLVTTYTYDPLSLRLTRILTTRQGSDPATLQDLRYTYDPVGSITELRDYAQPDVYYDNTVVSAHQTFIYDSLHRLVQAQGREHVTTLPPAGTDPPLHAHRGDGQQMQLYTELFDYDEVGNLVQLQHSVPGNSAASWTRTYAYDTTGNGGVGSNRLASTTVGTTTIGYAHDAHGNLTQLPHLPAMDWDHADQLRHVDKGGGGEAWFQYDAAGQRVRKVWEHGAYRDERIYLGGLELWRRRDAQTGEVLEERQTVHLADDAGRVCMVETKTIDAGAPVGSPQPRYRYSLDNHLGTAVVEVDEAGAVISYEEYHPYGTTAYRAADSAVDVSPRRYRYTGKEKDEETGLYYHGARYYAAWLARWTAADPSGLVDGVNLYRYVRGSPIVLRDPDGRQAKEPRPGEVSRAERDAAYGKFRARLEALSDVQNNAYHMAPRAHGRVTDQGLLDLREYIDGARARLSKLNSAKDRNSFDDLQRGIEGTVHQLERMADEYRPAAALYERNLRLQQESFERAILGTLTTTLAARQALYKSMGKLDHLTASIKDKKIEAAYTQFVKGVGAYLSYVDPLGVTPALHSIAFSEDLTPGKIGDTAKEWVIKRWAKKLIPNAYGKYKVASMLIKMGDMLYQAYKDRKIIEGLYKKQAAQLEDVGAKSLLYDAMVKKLQAEVYSAEEAVEKMYPTHWTPSTPWPTRPSR